MCSPLDELPKACMRRRRKKSRKRRRRKRKKGDEEKKVQDKLSKSLTHTHIVYFCHRKVVIHQPLTLTIPTDPLTLSQTLILTSDLNPVLSQQV